MSDAVDAEGADAFGPLGGLGLLLASRPPGLRGGVKTGSGTMAYRVSGGSERDLPRGLLLLSLMCGSCATGGTEIGGGSAAGIKTSVGAPGGAGGSSPAPCNCCCSIDKSGSDIDKSGIDGSGYAGCTMHVGKGGGAGGAGGELPPPGAGETGGDLGIGGENSSGGGEFGTCCMIAGGCGGSRGG